MNTLTLLNSNQIAARHEFAGRPALDRLLTVFDQLAEQSPYFTSKSLGRFESAGQQYSLPRYLFIGPRGGGDVIRIGIFATIHGDESEGAQALLRLVTALGNEPEIAQGYALFIYPVCNPTGFEDGTRNSRGGRDLNQEFWKNTPALEVQFLESEIYLHAFNGIITLHSNHTGHGLYGHVGGDVLSKYLIEPALHAAEKFYPRDSRQIIEEQSASHGIITDAYPGGLKTVPGVARPPFEITLESPRRGPANLQIEALKVALRNILIEYRQLIAVAQNI